MTSPHVYVIGGCSAAARSVVGGCSGCGRGASAPVRAAVPAVLRADGAGRGGSAQLHAKTTGEARQVGLFCMLEVF